MTALHKTVIGAALAVAVAGFSISGLVVPKGIACAISASLSIATEGCF